ncbi:MAG: acyl-CoA dehydrogenase [Alphaproteobacteria bacterium]|nr:acyl-CoA dehydrogenase [Alphaproteobacteria bacterium]
MIPYSAPLQDMRFVMQNIAGLDQVAALPGYEMAERDLVDQILEEANKLASDVLAPLNMSGDQEGASIENGVVRTPGGFSDAYKQFIEGGWNGVPFEEEFGGQGLPWLVQTALHEMWQAANMSFGLCPLLTQGAIEAITAHGTEQQKAVYLTKLIEGTWTGTMNLTEPQAGSDVGALKTKATPNGDHYLIQGTKIYITYGDHDFSENIVHLVLARLPGAPAGTRGISLFVVPKFLPNEDGTPGKRNDLRAVSIEHKLGIHGSPTCVMSYGDDGGAVGYLLGEENKGMACMFTMMNNARLAVGLQGLAISERSYQQAVGYARDRVQSRSIEGSSGPVSIIQHPDVRRMLMEMRAKIEAMRAMTYWTAALLDHANANPEPEAQHKAQMLVDLMTPICKAWCTDQGVGLTSIGVQVHGGMGFVEETGAAQHYRDARINPIYEGTNAIQANDLLGRKLIGHGGASMYLLLGEIKGDLAAMEDGSAIKTALLRSLADLEEATTFMMETFPHDRARAAAGAVPYLDLVATVIGGWLMGRSAAIAAAQAPGVNGDGRFLAGKAVSARYYADYVLPQTGSLKTAIMNGADGVLGLDLDLF